MRKIIEISKDLLSRPFENKKFNENRVVFHVFRYMFGNPNNCSKCHFQDFHYMEHNRKYICQTHH